MRRKGEEDESLVGGIAGLLGGCRGIIDCFHLKLYEDLEVDSMPQERSSVV